MKMVEGDQPALQVIVLGAGGGPNEDNVTAFLTRSVAAGWTKGCLLAVDAGVHLAAITKILETHLSSTVITGKGKSETSLTTLINGPFAGLTLPHSSAKANAAYITKTLVETYLITHPHLDHISGFVVNTAALSGLRTTKLAGLPFTINAFKNHIFNNVIWPNLSDEDGGAGLVTYMRLIEGGSPVLGVGEGKGYAEVCEGLSVKAWSVSHGRCMETHSHRDAMETSPYPGSSGLSPEIPKRRPSRADSTASTRSRGSAKPELPQSHDCVYSSATYFIRDSTTGKELIIFGDVEPDSISSNPRNKRIWQQAAPKIVSGNLLGIFIECSYDDSRDEDMLFGHLSPKYLVQELQALAVEVDAVKDGRKRKREDNSTSPRRSPRSTRASPQDTSLRTKSPYRKAKNSRQDADSPPYNAALTPRTNSSSALHHYDELSPRRARPRRVSPRQTSRILSHDSTPPPAPPFQCEVTKADEDLPGGFPRSPSVSPELEANAISTPTINGSLPLSELKIVVIHIKDKLDDGPDVGDLILQQLRDHARGKLGCEFIIAKPGQSVYL